MSKEKKTNIRLFCDSEEAFYELVKSERISSNVEVYTRSFVIESNPNINSVYIDETISENTRRKFKSSIFPLEKEIEKIFDANTVSLSHKIIFQQTYNQFQADLLDGIMLDKLPSFSGKTLIARALTGRPDLDNVTRPNWIDWLADHVNTSVLKIDISYHNERATRGNVRTSLMNRLRLGRIEAVIWKLFKFNLIPSRFFKTDNIGIFGQTELMKDFVANCVLNSSLPKNLELPPVNFAAKEPDFKTADFLLGKCSIPLQKRLTYLKSKKLRSRADNIFRNRLAVELSTYDQCYRAWDNILSTQPKINVIISGFQKGAKARALSDICDKNKIKLISCQHGITRELLENVNERSIFFENSFCHIFIAANDTSAALTEKLKRHNNAFKTIVCKPSREVLRARASKPPKFDALFISTTLHSGHKPNGVPPTSDQKLNEYDLSLVKAVLGQTKKTIHYKPYPSVRQLDPDPVLAFVKNSSNMKVVGEFQDLRYMLSDYRIFITTRATSTVSWVVASGRPLVFIDHICHARLSNAARDAFSKAFFFFDQKDQNFHNSLKKFLELPFREIEHQWMEKASFRKKTVHEFFNANSVADIYSAVRQI